MLLNGKCSWSYKSLKDDGTKKTDTNMLPRAKSSGTTSAFKNNTEVYNFEVSRNKKKKFDKKDCFKSSGSEKDDPCYDCDEFSQKKKSKGKKKTIRNNKNIINDLCESPSITSKALRHKKRINYADSDEFDLILDKNEDSAVQTRKKSTHAYQVDTSRNSEYSDDERLVFQTRYSDKNASFVEITNSIESNSNDLFEETDTTTTTPTILKLHTNVESKSNEQTSSDNRTIHFEDSLKLNEVHETSESISENGSECENSFIYSSEIGIKETNVKPQIPREYGIDIEAEIFEKCRVICSDIQNKYDDLYFSDELKEEISDGDINRTKTNGKKESDHELEKLTNKNILKTKKIKHIDFKGNKNIEMSKNKTSNSKNNFTGKKPVEEILGTPSSNTDFIEERVDINIMEELKMSDFGSETTADIIERQIMEKNSGLNQNKETKENTPVKDFKEQQSLPEEENAEYQSKLKKEMFIKKVESSLNWDKTSDTEMESISNISPSSFFKKGTRLESSSEKTLSVNNNSILKTNSATLTYYFDNSSSPTSAESDSISEKECSFEKIKDISFNIDPLNMNENKISDFMHKREDSTSTNQQGIVLKKDGFNPPSKQVNKSNKVRQGKKIIVSQENNQKTSSFHIHKDTALTKQNFKSNLSHERSAKSNPKTWEDLEAKLLSETDDFCKISSNSYQEIRSRDNLWFEEKEFETRKITKRFYQTTSKEANKNLCLNYYKKKSINADCNEVLPVTNSPNLNIITKAIQAMEKCTATYISPFEKDAIDHFKKHEENDFDEYSISVHSTLIQSSKSKLSSTNTYFQKTSKINKNVKKGKKILENKNINDNLKGKNSSIPTAKINVLKVKKISNFPKLTENSTNNIMKNLKNITEQDTSDNFTNFNMNKNNSSSTKDNCALYNSTVLPQENKSDKSRQHFIPIETNSENRYSFRKRKNKSTIENKSKKTRTELLSPEKNLKINNQDVTNDWNSLAKPQTAIKIYSKNKFNSPKINLAEKSKSNYDVDSGEDSNFSFNYSDEIASQLNSLDIESVTVKEKYNKVKSFKKKNNNSNIQSFSNLEEKVNFNNKKHMNIKNLKNNEENISSAKNTCMTKRDLVSKNSKGKVKLIKKGNTRRKYKEYLKKLFQSENPSHDKNMQNIEDESVKGCKKIQKEGNYDRESKLMMKDDELFSISSEDSEVDESGVFSEVNLTQNSGLFFDVLDEKEN